MGLATVRPTDIDRIMIFLTNSRTLESKTHARNAKTGAQGLAPYRCYMKYCQCRDSRSPDYACDIMDELRIAGLASTGLVLSSSMRSSG